MKYFTTQNHFMVYQNDLQSFPIIKGFLWINYILEIIFMKFMFKINNSSIFKDFVLIKYI